MTTPDILILPDISAYFGVSLDELFAISDDTRIERIQNILWDVRFRLKEASEYNRKYAEIDNSYRVLLYQGKIAWADGRRGDAFSFWNEMEMRHPNEWCVYHNIADYLTRAEDCEKAERYYMKDLYV